MQMKARVYLEIITELCISLFLDMSFVANICFDLFEMGCVMVFFKI